MNIKGNFETATFAGGCFWCTEAVFKRLKGVEKVISGYAGGDVENPNYEQVSGGGTKHAEAIQVKFDPKIISYDRLLDIFWATHNPTTRNQQGADVGTQYRSVIFYHSDEQKEKALKSKEKMDQSGKFKDQIVTEVAPFDNFYDAESYHQNYYDKNQDAPYCNVVINPKIEKLIKEFNEDLKEEYKI
ncbi:MAG: peptide-methionine (S)-S-oxide reductase MsrA [Patescibacteria group bacterium]